jgi:undecaprenyl diphosphate synthase
MTKPSEGPLDPRAVLGLEPEQLPRHIAIIMDGNGRWAGQRNLPRVRGHEEGAKAVRTAATQCARLGIQALTLFSFSAENWRRPKEEIDFLMRLCVQYLAAERNEIVQNNIRLLHVGRREGLPEDVLRELDATIEQSRLNTGLQMALALNYGSRTEILDAVKRIARRVGDGDLRVEDIDETLFSRSLYTSELPDPDLLIRTASEYRISNFLLWQISYAELYVTDVLWPDFGAPHLHAAIQEYARRERRFGAVGKQT